MKRRDFAKLLGAGFGAALVPLQVSPVQAAFSSDTVWRAKLLAQSHNRCSPQMLMRHLKINADAARNLQNLLWRRGIVTASDAAGVARAVAPTNTAFLPQNAPANPSTLAKQAKVQPSEGPVRIAQKRSPKPERHQDETEQRVPARHRDPEQIPDDLVATHDGGGEDLIEELVSRQPRDIP